MESVEMQPNSELSKISHLQERAHLHPRVNMKFLLVVVAIIALAASAFFTAGLTATFVAAGAASWKIGMATIGCIASVVLLARAFIAASESAIFDETQRDLLYALPLVQKGVEKVDSDTLATTSDQQKCEDKGEEGERLDNP